MQGPFDALHLGPLSQHCGAVGLDVCSKSSSSSSSSSSFRLKPFWLKWLREARPIGFWVRVWRKPVDQEPVKLMEGRQWRLLEEYTKLQKFEGQVRRILVFGAGLDGVEWMTELEHFLPHIMFTIVDFAEDLQVETRDGALWSDGAGCDKGRMHSVPKILCMYAERQLSGQEDARWLLCADVLFFWA